MALDQLNNRIAKQQKLWISLSLLNFGIVALLGFLLRTKILFSLPFINYGHLINAHAHFALSGWITLTFFTLFLYTIIPASRRGHHWYPIIFWGIQLSSYGMLFSFSLKGYGALSFFFAALFICCVYAYSWRFIKDLLAGNRRQPVFTLALSAILSLIISSGGLFALAYMMSTGSGNSIMHRDAFYFYLHFLYNGFFTLSVFALLFQNLFGDKNSPLPKTINTFSNWLCASVIPSFFLTLLWHSENWLIRSLAIVGIISIIISLVYFFKIFKLFPLSKQQHHFLPRLILFLVLLSFIIKSVLQMGTIIPALATAAFGVRPVIIGFLHLVFLGLATFYIFYHHLRSGILNRHDNFTKTSLWLLVIAVVLQEIILMLFGLGMVLGNAFPSFNYILWILSICLFLSAVLLNIARRKNSLTPL